MVSGDVVPEFRDFLKSRRPRDLVKELSFGKLYNELASAEKRIAAGGGVSRDVVSHFIIFRKPRRGSRTSHRPTP